MSILMLILMFVSILAGRLLTFHLTEGEAFVEGFPFWAFAVIFGWLAFLFRREA